jgi:hypothetical protein
MLKKLIGLGLVFGVATAASALAGGCTTTTTTVQDDGGGTGTGGGKEGGTTSHPDGGNVTATDGGSTSTGACPAQVDTSMIPAYKSPKSGQNGSCSATDISAVSTQLNNSMATFMDVYNAVSATCQKCMFASSGDANWALITWDPDMASGTAFVDYGACFELAPGGSMACGKGIQDDQFCLDMACPQTCTDQMGCVMTATSGGCMAQDAEVTSGCGSSVTALNAKCGKFIDALTTVCGGGAGDSGTD